jgi:nucleolin
MQATHNHYNVYIPCSLFLRIFAYGCFEKRSDCRFAFAESPRTPRERDDSRSIFIKGFDKYQGEEGVRSAITELFGTCGEVVHVRLPTDRETGELKGFGFVEFSDPSAKDKAAELDGSEAAGGWLKVDTNPGGGGASSGGRGGGFGGRSGGRGGGRFDSGGKSACFPSIRNP